MAKKETKKAFSPIDVKVDGKKFQITIPQFRYNGELFVAEEAAKNKELLAELVKIQFGGLKEVFGADVPEAKPKEKTKTEPVAEGTGQ